MIQGWYCGEKLDAYDSQAIMGQWLFLFSKYVGDSDWRFHSPIGSHHLSQAFDFDEEFLFIFKTSVILAFLKTDEARKRTFLKDGWNIQQE